MIKVKPVVGYGQQIAAAVLRDKVYRLESLLLTMPQIDCPVRNYFADGLYAREMTIPAGTVVTGAVHKTQHLVVLSKGRVLVAGPDGPVERVAPYIGISEPGVKNAVHVIEDAVWTTFHANPDDEKSIDVLVERHTTSKNSDLLGNRQIAHDKPELAGE